MHFLAKTKLLLTVKPFTGPCKNGGFQRVLSVQELLQRWNRLECKVLLNSEKKVTTRKLFELFTYLPSKYS